VGTTAPLETQSCAQAGAEAKETPTGPGVVVVVGAAVVVAEAAAVVVVGGTPRNHVLRSELICRTAGVGKVFSQHVPMAKLGEKVEAWQFGLE